MILSKEDMSKINHFASDAGGSALSILAQLIDKYYTHQLAQSDTMPELFRNQGSVRLANFLNALPGALRERKN